jgi:peptidoglycan/LPS O-acetylase OafA/YrhL
MSKQEVPASDSSPSASDRVEKFLAGVYALQVPSQTERRERRLLWSGVVIAIAGFAVIGMGWWGASGTKYVYQEIPYVISGGIFGAALVIVGAALFARYSAARLLRFWLARLLADQQVQTDRVVDAITALTVSIQNETARRDDNSPQV